jgi:hypothetical protein
VVVLRAETQELRTLPYDLLQAGRQLSFNLRDLFPNLSYPVIQALDRTDLDTLYQAQTKYKPEPLGDNTSKDIEVTNGCNACGYRLLICEESSLYIPI